MPDSGDESSLQSGPPDGVPAGSQQTELNSDATTPWDLGSLAAELGRQRTELERFRQIIENINRGVHLEEILDFVYNEFRDLIPYNRISYAALDLTTGTVIARWVRSDKESRIPADYSQPLAKTRLGELLETGRPRIINDIVAYLAERPYSASTRQLLTDGMRSSLTCPLIVEGRGVGFLFFDSHLPAAYSHVHVELFEQIASVVAVVIERGRMYSELAGQKALIEEQARELQQEGHRRARELELARMVQRALIPGVLPQCTSLRMAMHYEPAEQVGGDLLDCIPLGSEDALVYVADAMGHGVPAALVMSVVRTAFHAALGKQPEAARPSPAALLTEVNRTLVDLFGQHLVTAVCVRIDKSSRSVTVSLAGHPPALIRRCSTGKVVAIPARSVPLGIKADTIFVDAELAFEAGDTLLLYTDGVIEATAPDDTSYGLTALKERLEDWGAGEPDALVQLVRETVRQHSGAATLEDDLTLLVVQATPES